jgi:flagellar biosynthesis protein
MVKRVASAIGYSPEKDSAPRVLAKGSGRTAEQIIAVARESGVVIVEDSALAAMLDSTVNPGDLIPVWCWEAEEKILVFVRTEL